MDISSVSRAHSTFRFSGGVADGMKFLPDHWDEKLGSYW